MIDTNVFDLSPEEFRQQDEAERRAEQTRRTDAEVAAREKAEAEATKKANAAKAHTDRWVRWLMAIGANTGRKFEVVLLPNNQFRPAELFIEDVRVPVSQGFGTGMSLEISLQWHTVPTAAGYQQRRVSPDRCTSRQKKNGSFNYAALATMAVYYVEAEKKYQREQGNKAGATSMVEQLKVDLAYSNMEPSTDPAKPVQFKFSINRDMTETEARAAYAALVLAGLIVKKG